MKDGKPQEDKKPFGRPTLYDPKYCEEIMDFFSTPYFKEIMISKVAKGGIVIKIPIDVPNDFPLFEKYAANIGVNRDTLKEWRKKHDDFSAAYKICKELQKARLIQLTLSGHYNPAFSIFTAKNITDMQDVIINKTEEDDDDDLENLNLEELTSDELDTLQKLIKKAQRPTEGEQAE